MLSKLKHNPELSSGILSGARPYHVIPTFLPTIIANNFMQEVEGMTKRGIYLQNDGMDKTLQAAGKKFSKWIDENARDEEVQKFSAAIEEYNKPDGQAKVILIKNMPLKSEVVHHTVLAQLGVFGMGSLLMATGLWKDPYSSDNSTFIRVNSEEGHGYKLQPHVDESYATYQTPEMISLLCINNQQKTPTYFISAQEIFSKFSEEEKKILVRPEFVIRSGDRCSEKFPIFCINGTFDNPGMVTMCYDLGSKDDFAPDKSSGNLEALQKVLTKLSEVVYEVAAPYDTQVGVPENNRNTSQVILQTGDAAFWHNIRGMHARTAVVGDNQNMQARVLLRTSYETGRPGFGM